MTMNKNTPRNMDDYVGRFPQHVQQRLTKMRATIRKAAPKAQETISYGMPAFRLDGILVWFAAHQRHIGFYPRASGITAFKSELSEYKVAKGSVQFPLDKPLPLALVRRMVRFRVKEERSTTQK